MIPSLFRKPSSWKLLALIGLCLGVALGVSADFLLRSQCYAEHMFIDGGIACGPSYVLDKSSYTATQNAIEGFISDAKAKGEVQDVAVYFSDLRNGPFFSINGMMDFAPASLLKLPLAILYFDNAESDPGILTEQLSVADPLWSFSEFYPPTQEVDPTVPHTVQELLEHMVTYSDNNAYGVLQTHLYDIGQQATTTQTFLELGFINPQNVNDEVISVRQYADIFRVLYKASYLNLQDSEQLLTWLSHSQFMQGLRAGLPKGMVVADKFGERFTMDGTTKQLHDCGIIYYPANPYLLCVMTRGNDFNTLAGVIQHISAMVYQEVDSRRLQ